MRLLLKILFWVVIVSGVLFALGIAIMSAFGGNSPSWKKQIEDVASSVVGESVTFTTMNDARLYPKLMFDGEGINIQGQKNIIIEKLHFSVPFWTIFWGYPAADAFVVENFQIIGDERFRLDKAAIVVPVVGAPRLNLAGHYNGLTYSGFIELENSWGGYRPQPITPVDLKIDSIVVTAIMALGTQNPLRDIKVSIADRIYNGNLEVLSEGNFTMSLVSGDRNFMKITNPPPEIPDNYRYRGDLDTEDGRQITRIICAATTMDYLSLAQAEGAFQTVSCLEKKPEDPVQDVPEDGKN